MGLGSCPKFVCEMVFDNPAQRHVPFIQSSIAAFISRG